MDWRTHDVDQTQNLIQAPQNETWDQRIDASLRATDVGLFVDSEWRWSRWIKLSGGVRADVLHFDIDDRLGNFIPIFQRQSHLPGYRRTALGVAWGPRATLVLEPLLIKQESIEPTEQKLEVFLSYGQGYRSPQARQLDEGENAPFATVHSLETGRVGIWIRLWI